jgi:ribonuclease J
MGVDPENILISLDGDQLELTDDGLRKVGEVPAGYLYVDGAGLGDVGQGVLRDRRILAEEGVVVVIVTIDVKSGEIIAGP